MAMKTITYKDPTGALATGYVDENNKTYTDAAGTTRIGVNSAVRADNGDVYYMGDTGGNLLGNQSANDFYTSSAAAATSSTSTSDQYIKDLYAQKQQASIDALNAAYSSNSATINASKAALPATYQEAKNTTAGQSAVEKANFNEYAAASGLNNGTAGQAQLSFSNQLQGNLSTLDRKQAADTAALDLQMTQLTTDWKAKVAAAFNEGNYELANALYQNYQTEKAATLEQSRYDQSLATSQQQYNQSLAADQANTLANYGDFSGYKALGYSDEQIAQMNAAYIKANTKTTSSYSGGGTAKPNLTAAQAYAAYNNGMRTDAVVSAYEYYYGTTDVPAASPTSNYSLIRTQAMNYVGQMGASGGTSAVETRDALGNYLGNAVDSGEISQAEAEQIMLELT